MDSADKLLKDSSSGFEKAKKLISGVGSVGSFFKRSWQKNIDF